MGRSHKYSHAALQNHLLNTRLDVAYTKETPTLLVPDIRTLLVKHKQMLSSERFESPFPRNNAQLGTEGDGLSPARYSGLVPCAPEAVDVRLRRSHRSARGEHEVGQVGVPTRRHVEACEPFSCKRFCLIACCASCGYTSSYLPGYEIQNHCDTREVGVHTGRGRQAPEER
ncbi:hypothetical protein C8Q77DRAFT_105744 [Trametes polyzona]|nr:hypothetical protein C8Q77DRAFT_105744 [Trametes polyzona]